MYISKNGKNLIKNFEGLRLKAYRCSANKLTIGYGHTGVDVKESMLITQEQANLLFDKDIDIHCKNVQRLMKVQLTQNEFDALVSFEFNVGFSKLAKSTLLKKLNSGNKSGAADELLRWVYAGNKPLEGLKRRRIKEREVFLYGYVCVTTQA